MSDSRAIAEPIKPFSGLYVGVSGANLLNEDGTSRQAEIRRCLPGDKVQLQPGSDSDSSPCVRVMSPRGRQIGEIVGADAQTISQQLEVGNSFYALVNSVHGHATPNRRVVLVISSHEKPPLASQKAGFWTWFRRTRAG